MSRIPPASIRLTSNTLNYAFLGTSTYFFTSQLKQNLALQFALQRLGKVLRWISSPPKRKTLAVLQPGVMPIYSQLRAARFVTLQFTQSYSWYMRKTITGARYYFNLNISNLSKAQHLNAIQPSSVDARTDSKASLELNTIKRFCVYSLNRFKRLPKKRLQMIKPRQLRFFKHGGYISNKYVLNKAKVFKKCAQQLALTFNKSKRVSASIFNSSSLAFSSVLTKAHQNYVSPKLQVVLNNFACQYKSLPLNKQTLNYKKPATSLSSKSFVRKPIASNILFYLFCVQQLTGKMYHAKSLDLISASPASIKPLKAFKKTSYFYDFEFLKSLEAQPYHVHFRHYDHYPKITVGRPIQDPLLNKNTDTRNLHQPKVGYSVNHLNNSVTTNVNPKMGLVRGFNMPLGLHLFSFLEGRFALGLRQAGDAGNSAKTKTASFSKPQNQLKNLKVVNVGNPVFSQIRPHLYKQKIGLSRLKTALVFKLGLRFESKTQNLRPTLSVRL